MLRYRIQVSSGPLSLDIYDISSSITAGEFNPSENCIKIANVPKDTNTVIFVPHTDASRFSAVVCQESHLYGLPFNKHP